MTVLKLLYLGLDFEALGLSKDMYTNSWLTPAKTIGKSDTGNTHTEHLKYLLMFCFSLP
jgi:hypothetical protein